MLIMKVNNTVLFCTHFGEDSFLHDSRRKRPKEIEDASITPNQKRHKELEDSFTGDVELNPGPKIGKHYNI